MIDALDARVKDLEIQIHFLNDALNEERIVRSRVQNEIRIALIQVAELIQAINELALSEGDLTQKNRRHAIIIIPT